MNLERKLYLHSLLLFDLCGRSCIVPGSLPNGGLRGLSVVADEVLLLEVPSVLFFCCSVVIHLFGIGGWWLLSLMCIVAFSDIGGCVQALGVADVL